MITEADVKEATTLFMHPDTFKAFIDEATRTAEYLSEPTPCVTVCTPMPFVVGTLYGVGVCMARYLPVGDVYNESSKLLWRRPCL